MFYLLCLKHREIGRISQSQLVSLRLLPGLMVSVGNSKIILFQISSSYWQQRQIAFILHKKKSDSKLCEIYKEEDNLWSINPYKPSVPFRPVTQHLIRSSLFANRNIYLKWNKNDNVHQPPLQLELDLPNR